jgi:hypothetical protein
VKSDFSLSTPPASETKKETEMNFTGGNTFPSIGKRINWQIAALAGGLALLSAGALTTVLDRDGSPATTSTVRPSQPPAVSAPARVPGQPSEMVYLVVGSQAQGAELRAVISSYAAAYEELAGQATTTRVVVIENAEQEARFNTQLATASGELMAYDIGQRVIDLRAPQSPALPASSRNMPSETIVYIVASQADKLALETQFHETGATMGDTTQRTVFVADTPEQQALLPTLFGEQAGGGFSVVDLR